MLYSALQCLIINFHTLQLLVACTFQSTILLLQFDSFDFESKLHIITSDNFASAFPYTISLSIDLHSSPSSI